MMSLPENNNPVSNPQVSSVDTETRGDDWPDLGDSTILIVDDNAQNVELLQAYLEVLPCRTVAAYDGVEALKYFEGDSDQIPDLVLLDIMMPKMSGFEVCRKLKEDPVTRCVPIMMVTALNELGDIERSIESGIDDFLTKPVNKFELITRVRSLLRIRHLKRELDRTVAYIQDVESHSRLRISSGLQTDQDHVGDPGGGPIA